MLARTQQKEKLGLESHNDWEVPVCELIEFTEKKNDYCVVSAAWDEGQKSYEQYRRMARFLDGADFLLANRGELLLQEGADTLRDSFQIRSLLQVEEPGQSTAYRCVLAYALEQGYKGVVMIDSNGKDSVDRIPAFLAKLRQGEDFVQASRFLPGGGHANTPMGRIVAIRLVAPLILWLGCGYWYSDQPNGFKGFSRKFLLDARVRPFRDIFRSHNLQVYLNYIAPKLGYCVIELPTKRLYPSTGGIPTKINSFRLLCRLLGDYVKTAFGMYSVR